MFTLKDLEIIKTALNSLMDDIDEFSNDYPTDYKADVIRVSANVDIQILTKKF